MGSEYISWVLYLKFVMRSKFAAVTGRFQNTYYYRLSISYSVYEIT